MSKGRCSQDWQTYFSTSSDKVSIIDVSDAKDGYGFKLSAGVLFALGLASAFLGAGFIPFALLMASALVSYGFGVAYHAVAISQARYKAQNKYTANASILDVGKGLWPIPDFKI